MNTVGDLLVEFRDRPKNHTHEVLTLTEKNGFIRQSERFNKRLATEDISKYKLIKRGDIAFNPYLLWAGAVAQNTIVDEGVISPLYPTFRVRPNVDHSFARHILLSAPMIARYDTIAFGSVPRRRRSSVQDFLSLPIPALPRLDDQRRIAAILDQSARLLSTASHHSQLTSIFARQAFIKLFGTPSSWADRWPMAKIGDIATSTQYGSSEKSSTYGPTPVLRMGNLTVDGRIDLSDLKYMTLAEKDQTKHTVRQGDILFNRTNSPDLVGKTAVVRSDDEYAYAGYLIRVRVSEKADPEFVAAYLNSEYGKFLLRSMCKSIVGQANINAKELKSIPIAVPPRALQSEFAKIVARLEEELVRGNERGQILNSLHASLQSRAFQGEL